ncbi:Uncharacterized protein PECH_006704 [Penicillium ucsense]|uniref:Uncharacterized protein n=1 Tax=Penicillium ucsense TaxID=2839758 RepID=A0A8J8W6K7_9EURO|nr:Uncharacterized protein PECM_004349 [Penicillium ucsense]KAF7735402.1 Uncharacterized protein PECH_006704 [Penicillium ucsense]
MSAQGPAALPPTTVLSTKPISQSEAHEFLAMYLERARTDASLQPNASINESGPVSRTTSAAPNLILHNLKRVQAGLAGEVLGRDLTVQKQNPGEDYLDIPTTEPTQDQAENGEDGENNDLEMNDVEMETEAEAFAEQEEEQASVDKEERKRRKKERRLAEKKAKAKQADDSD